MIDKLETYLKEMLRWCDLLEEQGFSSEYGRGKRDTYQELLDMINNYFGTNEEAK